jgi:hypothetical protein
MQPQPPAPATPATNPPAGAMFVESSTAAVRRKKAPKRRR